MTSLFSTLLRASVAVPVPTVSYCMYVLYEYNEQELATHGDVTFTYRANSRVLRRRVAWPR
jgi:hypothetical protein